MNCGRKSKSDGDLYKRKFILQARRPRTQEGRSPPHPLSAEINQDWQAIALRLALIGSLNPNFQNEIMFMRGDNNVENRGEIGDVESEDSWGSLFDD